MTGAHFLRVSGSHRMVGKTLGTLTREYLTRPPVCAKGLTLQDMRLRVRPYLEATADIIPWLHEEMLGLSDGSGVDMLDLYLHATEERVACSDIIALPSITMDHCLWLAHNNDLSPEVRSFATAILWEVDGQPPLFTLGIGPFISVGMNAAGIALTGNELSANDEKIGIPRLLCVRDILAQRTMADAKDAALRPERASSYNHIIGFRDGTVINIEASATAHHLLHPKDNFLVHTNHYCAKEMEQYEDKPTDNEESRLRLERTQYLITQAERPVSSHMLRTMLSDHMNTPSCLCKHTGEIQTVYFCLINLTKGSIEYGFGPPCQATTQKFQFSPYPCT